MVLQKTDRLRPHHLRSPNQLPGLRRLYSFANLCRRVEAIKVPLVLLQVIQHVNLIGSELGTVRSEKEFSLSTLADAASLKAPHNPYLEDSPCIENDLPPLS